MTYFNDLSQTGHGRTIIATLVILLVALLIKQITIIVVNAALKKTNKGKNLRIEQRLKTIASIINNVLSIGIYGTAFITILSKWGLDITPILTGAGVLGLAVSFGAQTLVKDVVTGFFILLENQFNVGDKIKTAGIEGIVLELNLRTTVIQDSAKNIHIIPNSKIDTVSKLLN